MNNDTVTLAIAGANVTLPVSTLTALWLEKLRGSTKPASAIESRPSIGSVWFGQGGIYAGNVRGDKGQSDYGLIVAEAALDAHTWHDAMKWAAALNVTGLRDFALPLRKEQAILFGNVPELFAKEWYWSREEHASYSDYAWFQGFGDGYQYDDHEANELRARAVRRVPIEQFDPLII